MLPIPAPSSPNSIQMPFLHWEVQPSLVQMFIEHREHIHSFPYPLNVLLFWFDTWRKTRKQWNNIASLENTEILIVDS